MYVNSRTEIGWTNLFHLKMFNEKLRIDCKSFNPKTSKSVGAGPNGRIVAPWTTFVLDPYGSLHDASGFLTCFFMMKLFTVYVCVCIGEY